MIIGLKLKEKELSKKERNYLITLAISAIIFLGLFLWSLVNLHIIQNFSEAMTKSFTSDYNLNIIVLYALIIFIVFSLFGIIIHAIGIAEQKITQRKNATNKYKIILSLLILWTIIVGVIGYSTIFNQENFILKLRNETGISMGNISCSGPTPTIIQGQTVNCRIFPELNNISGKIQFDEESGNFSVQELDNNLSFVAPYKQTIYIKIWISGKDEKNVTQNLSIGKEYFFPNIINYKNNAVNFIKFLALLFGLAFISIPTAIYFIRQIVENRD